MKLMMLQKKRSLDLVHEVKCDDEVRIYNKSELCRAELIVSGETPTFDDIEELKIFPLSIEGTPQSGYDGDFYKLQMLVKVINR